MGAEKQTAMEVGIVEAIDTLSRIVALELESPVGVAETHSFDLQSVKVKYSTVHWLHKEDPDSTVRLVKGVFGSILQYLNEFYEHEVETGDSEDFEEQLKAIMVLVGDAAKKLDKMTALYRGRKLTSVTELPPFKKLQTFYRQKIAKENKHLQLQKFVPTVISRRGAKISLNRKVTAKNAYVDMDAVNKDLDYELFYLKKEGGRRFYNTALLRNMNLVSEVGGQFGGAKSDPLVSLAVWLDRVKQTTARSVLKAVAHRMDHFFQVYGKVAEESKALASLLNKMCMALMLAGNPRNLMRNSPVKNCTQYYVDFRRFVQEALNSRDYRRLGRKHAKKTKDFGWVLSDLVNYTCQALCLNSQGHQALEGLLLGFLEKERPAVDVGVPGEGGEESLARFLRRDYEALTSLFAKHPNGPLNRVLDDLNKHKVEGFDPLAQGNIPFRLFNIFYEHTKATGLRLPSPTRQEFIHEAAITPQFEAMLRGYGGDQVRRKHLLINLQDRTAWREHPRCKVLEELEGNEEYAKVLTVVTFPKNTDFYHQQAPYHDLDDAVAFLEQFEAHLQSEHAGFYFSGHARRAVSHRFLSKLLPAVHKVFFNNRETLTRQERLDFIEIAYIFMQLKLIEQEKATSFSLTCKDSVDVGMAATVQLYVYLKALNKSPVTDEERLYLDLMVHGAPIILRERPMLPGAFDRMLSTLDRLEEVMHREGTPRAFSLHVTKEILPLFKTAILRKAHIDLPEFSLG